MGGMSMKRWQRGGASLIVVFLACLPILFHAPRFIAIKPGRSYEAGPPNNIHLYRLALEPGWFTRLYLEQMGIDLTMTLISPSGEIMHVQDSENLIYGGELICFIAREQGTYILEVSNSDPSNDGRYRLTSQLVRKPGKREEDLARARALGYRADRAAKPGKRESYTRALGLHEAALELWRQSGEREEVALTYLDMQWLWKKLYQKDRQIECLEQAASIFQSLGQEQTAGLVYHNLGAAFHRSGAFERAIRSFDRALEFRAQPDRMRAITLNELANTHLVLGRLDVSEMFLSQSRAIYQALGDDWSIAKNYQQYGQHLSRLGRREQAIAMFERALALAERSDNPYKLTVLNGLGKALLKERRGEEALAVFKRALNEPILEEASYLDWKIRIQVNLSEALLDQGFYDQALIYLNQGLKWFEAMEAPEERAHVLYNRARAERGANNLKRALNDIEAALTILDESRFRAKSPAIRADYVANHFYYHDFYLSLLMKMGEAEPVYEKNAFLYLERIRARNLLDALARDATPFNDGREPERMDHVRNLQTQIATLTWEKSRSGADNEADPELLNLLRQYDSVLGELEGNQEQTPPSIDGLTLEEIQDRLLDDETLLLVYAFGETESWLWLVDQTHFETFRLAPRLTIEAEALALNRWLKHRDVIRLRTRVAEQARRMADHLLEPVSARLQGRRLLIAAAGALKYIPFGALPTPGAEATPLGLKHEIVYLHSMTTLAALRERSETRTQLGNELVVFAAPAFHAESKFPALPHTLSEAQTIASLAPAGARLFTDFQAAKTTALGGACANARILHFATHGLINLNRSELSALVLADTDRDGTPIDGFLRSYEVQTMTLKADLVVLSACESALGEQMRGEGLVGLPQSFLEAGAQGVLVSLWEMEDRATREWMSHFYRHLFAEGKGAAAALRYAQAAMQQTERWRDPYYWSGFVFLGDWRTFFH